MKQLPAVDYFNLLNLIFLIFSFHGKLAISNIIMADIFRGQV
ncbi:hypothetical protein [Escherichia coli IS35]|nr:hypothetical protein [Escherichia coli IS35]